MQRYSMQLSRPTTAILSLALLAVSSTAQLLTNGNSEFPACASTCTLLNQAAQACGGTATANQAIWSCFCQSGYLTSLYNSPSGICDAFCTNPSDNQQVMTWYKSNCGTDDGATEHANGAASNQGATTTVAVVVVTSTSTSAGATLSTGSAAALPSTTASGGIVASTPNTTQGSWWDNHYKWVIMLIALFVGLILFAFLCRWLKRLHDRKQDRIRDGFNAGITTRNVPTIALDTSQVNHSQLSAVGAMPSMNGRNSPVRTRDAFMPYGYGYTRSESRLASRGSNLGSDRMSPMTRGGTPLGDMEKDVGMDTTVLSSEGTPAKRQRRVMVRERSGPGPESPYSEKR